MAITAKVIWVIRKKQRKIQNCVMHQYPNIWVCLHTIEDNTTKAVTKLIKTPQADIFCINMYIGCQSCCLCLTVRKKRNPFAVDEKRTQPRNTTKNARNVFSEKAKSQAEQLEMLSESWFQPHELVMLDEFEREMFEVFSCIFPLEVRTVVWEQKQGLEWNEKGRRGLL